MGDVEMAENQLNRALTIQTATRHADHSEIAATEVALASVAELQGDLGGAVGYLESAVESLERLHPEHSALIEPLGRMARLKRLTGVSDEAWELVERGVGIVSETFGEASPRSSRLLKEQAILEIAGNNPAAALRTALEAEAVRRDQLRATIPAFPERQALALTELRQSALDPALSALALQGRSQTAEQVRRVWDSVIRSRALVFDSVASRRRLLAAKSDPELQDLAIELEAARSRLAGLLIRGPGVLPRAVHAKMVAEARSREIGIERKLALESRLFQRRSDRAEVGLGEAEAALPADSVLIAFVRFRRYEAPLSGGADGEPFYGAFVLAKGFQDATFIVVAEQERVDAAVQGWRARAERGLDGSAESEREFRVFGARVRELVWQPLAGRLKGVKRLFLVPDGSLHLVNPMALPDGEGGYLIEQGFRAHFLTAERDLVRSKWPVSEGSGLLAVGGVDFLR